MSIYMWATSQKTCLLRRQMTRLLWLHDSCLLLVSQKTCFLLQEDKDLLGPSSRSPWYVNLRTSRSKSPKIVFVGRRLLGQRGMAVSSVLMPRNALTFSVWIFISNAMGTCLVFPTCGNTLKNSKIGSWQCHFIAGHWQFCVVQKTGSVQVPRARLAYPLPAFARTANCLFVSSAKRHFWVLQGAARTLDVKATQHHIWPQLGMPR